MKIDAAMTAMMQHMQIVPPSIISRMLWGRRIVLERDRVKFDLAGGVAR